MNIIISISLLSEFTEI